LLRHVQLSPVMRVLPLMRRLFRLKAEATWVV
jgi:hypothetical protein